MKVFQSKLLKYSVSILTLFILFIVINACKSSEKKPLYKIDQSAISDSAMVVSAHPLASEVGTAILKQGGNALDAAVAVQFALAVVYPRAGNLGGGGLMVIRQADGSATTIDYREKAPAAASRDMYLDSLKNVVKGLSTAGHLASGVPGTPGGMWAAHQKHGKLEWEKLLQPALELAQNGYQISLTEANRLNKFEDAFRKNTISPTVFIKEEDWAEGQLLQQTDLAACLERILKNGRDGFYKGRTAELIVEEMKRGGGIITLEDLENYNARWRDPITTNYKNYRLISMPPPSSGGIAIAQMLEMIEPFPLAEYGFHSKEAIHLMTEVERRAYADRAKFLGDMDFYPVPLDSLMEADYLAERMADFSPETASVSDSIASGDFKIMLESFETTHTSVIDENGMSVSVTTTINSNFGNKVVVGGAGFFLNNEMDDFSSKPGTPNQFGLLGAEANAIAPNKRMLSSMTPTIIEKDGKLFMVLGAPGGSTIITAVFQTFVNVAEFGMPLNKAVWAGRFHHQFYPDEIWLEEGVLDTAMRDSLKAMGHKLKERKYMGVIKAIQVLPDGKLHGVGDKRNPDDSAVGY